jgi:deoxyribose-phosphate aldolase
MLHPLAPFLDLANHHANATPEDIRTLCADVVTYGLHAAFVNPCFIARAKDVLGDRAPAGTAISFPLGQETLASKISAANEAVQLGADELDIVPNLGLFLAGDTNGFLAEMTAIVESARMVGNPFGKAQGKPVVVVKFIVECGHFDSLPDAKKQLTDAALLIRQSGADFVKLCSGMGPRGVSLEDLKTVKEAVGDTIKIKVAGGVDTRQEAETMISAGANRIGTSHAVAIVTG